MRTLNIERYRDRPTNSDTPLSLFLFIPYNSGDLPRLFLSFALFEPLPRFPSFVFSDRFRPFCRSQRPTTTLLPLPACLSSYDRGRRDGRGRPELRTVHDSVAEKRRPASLGSLLDVDARLGLSRELCRAGACERGLQVGDFRLHCCSPSHCSSREAPPVAGFVRRICPQSSLSKCGLFGSTLQSIQRQATSFNFAW